MLQAGSVHVLKTDVGKALNEAVPMISAQIPTCVWLSPANDDLGYDCRLFRSKLILRLRRFTGTQIVRGLCLVH